MTRCRFPSIIGTPNVLPLLCLLLVLLQSILYGHGKNCTRPPVADKASFNVFITRNPNTFGVINRIDPEVEPNTRIRYTCDPGYFFTGATMSVCQGSGEWTLSGTDIECQGKPCPFLKPIIRGSRNSSAYFFGGDNVYYFCHPGYELVGEDYIFCMANGQWNADEPECKKIYCPALPLTGPSMTGRTSDRDFPWDSTVTYTCDFCHKMTGDATRKCQTDKTWSGQAPSCSAITCGPIPPPFYGDPDKSDDKCGITVTTVCQNLGVLDTSAVKDAQCMADGTWNIPLPNCFAPCTVKPVINGTVDNVGRLVEHEGNPTNLKCNKGSSSSHKTIPVCSNGTWDNWPKCITGGCKVPVVANGGVSAHGDIVENLEVVWFKCNKGYYLPNNVSSTCSKEKIADIPMCVPAPCPAPTDVEDIQMVKCTKNKTLAHNCEIKYSCTKKLLYPASATCKFGQWDPLVDCTPYTTNQPTNGPDNSWTSGITRSTVSSPSPEWCPYPSNVTDVKSQCATTVGERIDNGCQITYSCLNENVSKSTTCKSGQWGPGINCSSQPTEEVGPPTDEPETTGDSWQIPTFSILGVVLVVSVISAYIWRYRPGVVGKHCPCFKAQPQLEDTGLECQT